MQSELISQLVFCASKFILRTRRFELLSRQEKTVHLAHSLPVDSFELGVQLVESRHIGNTIFQFDITRKVRNDSLNLGIVEPGRPPLVSLDDRAIPRQLPVNPITGYVNANGLDAKSLLEAVDDHAPSHRLIARDVVRLPVGILVAEQPDHPLREIPRMGQSGGRRARVERRDGEPELDALGKRPFPCVILWDKRVRDARVPVGDIRTHYGVFRTGPLHASRRQKLLTKMLVPGVIPQSVRRGSVLLADGQVSFWTYLVHRRGRHENVLAALAPDDTERLLELADAEGEVVDNNVELAAR